MGKFLSSKDISAARHEQEVINSMTNRGEILKHKYVREYYVVCGCGVEGCGFISGIKRDDVEHHHKYF